MKIWSKIRLKPEKEVILNIHAWALNEIHVKITYIISLHFKFHYANWSWVKFPIASGNRVQGAYRDRTILNASKQEDHRPWICCQGTRSSYCKWKSFDWNISVSQVWCSIASTSIKTRSSQGQTPWMCSAITLKIQVIEGWVESCVMGDETWVFYFTPARKVNKSLTSHQSEICSKNLLLAMSSPVIC